MRALYASLVLATLSAAAAPAFADELDDLARAIDQSPDDARTYDAYATAALRAKRWDDAIRKLKVGVARIPSYAEGYYKLAYAYRQKKEWADAADYYRRYVTLNPSRTDTYYGLGAALEGLGDKQGAIDAYDKYVALEKSPAKQRFVDEARRELGKLRGASAPAAAVATPTPTPLPAPPQPPAGDAASWKAQGDQYRAQGKLAEAAAAYKHAVDADRNNLDLYNDLGNAYFALKQYPDAAQAFGDATRRDPNYALGWYNLAHALRKADRPREAADAYRRYIALKPDDPDPYYGLGQTLKMMGDGPGAIAAFQKYIAMEKRPEEQRWVEKARAELQALQAMQPHAPAAPPSSSSSGKIEDKSTGGDALHRRLDDDLRRDAVLPPSDDDMRLIDPFANDRLRDLKDPFRDQIVDPFARDDGPTASKDKLRAYGAALAAYRRALSRQAEDVSLRFERGVAAALAANSGMALRAWNDVRLDDPEVVAARQSVERIRKQLAAR